MSKLFIYSRKLQQFILAMFNWDIPVTMEWGPENNYGYLRFEKIKEMPKELFIFLPILIDEV